MFNVYFVNCLLACTLSYIFGWYMAKRYLERQFDAAMVRLVSDINKRIKASVTSDVTLN